MLGIVQFIKSEKDLQLKEVNGKKRMEDEPMWLNIEAVKAVGKSLHSNIC